MTEILSNGSKWHGQKPDSIDILKQMLKDHALDPSFEDYGNFVNRKPQWIESELQIKYTGCTTLFGNFLDYSHVFSIITDNEQLISEIELLVAENKNRPEYIKAKNLLLSKKAAKG